jgi:hypothetical protein
MERFLLPLIISHGFFDIIDEKQKNLTLSPKILLKYLKYIGIFYFFNQIFPVSMILIFIFGSIYHFNFDFIPIESKFFNLRLDYRKMGSIVLLGTFMNNKSLEFWQKNIMKLDLDLFWANFIILNVLGVVLLYFIGVFYDEIISEKRIHLGKIFLISILLLNGYLNNPYYAVINYLGYYHTPLAVYVLDRKQLFILGKEYKIFKIWILNSIIVFVFLEIFSDLVISLGNNIVFLKLVMSILISHILFDYKRKKENERRLKIELEKLINNFKK